MTLFPIKHFESRWIICCFGSVSPILQKSHWAWLLLFKGPWRIFLFKMLVSEPILNAPEMLIALKSGILLNLCVLHLSCIRSVAIVGGLFTCTVTRTVNHSSSLIQTLLFQQSLQVQSSVLNLIVRFLV